MNLGGVEMEIDIKEIAYKSLSLLIVAGVITEDEFNKATNDKHEGYDDLFNLLEEKHKQYRIEA